MEPVDSAQNPVFKKLLPPSSCNPTFKLCLPVDFVTRFMNDLIGVTLDLREPKADKCWKVSVGQRRNKSNFEYHLLEWRIVCEQIGLQAGDEVHFTLLGRQLELRVSHRRTSASASPALDGSWTQKGTAPTTSSPGDAAHVEQLQMQHGATDIPATTSSCIPWQPQPPDSSAHLQVALPDFNPRFPSPMAGMMSDPKEALDQMLNLSMGFGLEGLLDAGGVDNMLPRNRPPSTPVQMGSASMPYMECSNDRATGIGQGAECLPSSPCTTTTTSLANERPTSKPHSHAAAVLPDAQNPSRRNIFTAAGKRCRETTECDRLQPEPVPFSGGGKFLRGTSGVNRVVAATHATAELPAVTTLANGHSSCSIPSLETCKPDNLQEETEALLQALRAEKGRADWEEEKCYRLLQTMKEAEILVKRKTRVAIEGVDHIFQTASQLVGSEMLRHLGLPKARELGSLQVQLKLQATLIHDSLSQLQALTAERHTQKERGRATASIPLPGN